VGDKVAGSQRHSLLWQVDLHPHYSQLDIPEALYQVKTIHLDVNRGFLPNKLERDAEASALNRTRYPVKDNILYGDHAVPKH
jgi:hypothetical protein